MLIKLSLVALILLLTVAGYGQQCSPRELVRIWLDRGLSGIVGNSTDPISSLSVIDAAQMGSVGEETSRLEQERSGVRVVARVDSLASPDRRNLIRVRFVDTTGHRFWGYLPDPDRSACSCAVSKDLRRFLLSRRAVREALIKYNRSGELVSVMGLVYFPATNSAERTQACISPLLEVRRYVSAAR